MQAWSIKAAEISGAGMAWDPGKSGYCIEAT